jgi:ubiquinone biosynthesis protein UbiJ
MTLVTRSILAALNHLLGPATWARERLTPHAESIARLRAEALEIDFEIDANGFLRASAEDARPAVTLSVSLDALPGVLTGDLNKAMSSVRIEGNAELADALGFVFRNLQWDSEEDLSRILGDIAAHRVVRGAQNLRTGGVRALNNLGENLSEYFTEEQQFLVTRNALADFAHEIRRLRDDLARMDKRTARLLPTASTPRRS